MNKITPSFLKTKPVFAAALACFLVLSSCKTEKIQPREIQRGKLADSIMVVSAREEASSIGAEILKMAVMLLMRLLP